MDQFLSSRVTCGFACQLTNQVIFVIVDRLWAPSSCVIPSIAVICLDRCSGHIALFSHNGGYRHREKQALVSVRLDQFRNGTWILLKHTFVQYIYPSKLVTKAKPILETEAPVVILSSRWRHPINLVDQDVIVSEQMTNEKQGPWMMGLRWINGIVMIKYVTGRKIDWEPIFGANLCGIDHEI